MNQQQTKHDGRRVIRAGQSVFADLGFSPSEAAELEVKAELARLIYNRIKNLALTQTQAARRLGLSQPDVSKLMSGRHTGYSVGRLLALLNALAMDVDIVVRPKSVSRAHRTGGTRVRELAPVA